ncbi:MAG: hypothetical protein R3C26_11805 [Calditrichia bacterium]
MPVDPQIELDTIAIDFETRLRYQKNHEMQIATATEQSRSALRQFKKAIIRRLGWASNISKWEI